MQWVKLFIKPRNWVWEGEADIVRTGAMESLTDTWALNGDLKKMREQAYVYLGVTDWMLVSSQSSYAEILNHHSNYIKRWSHWEVINSWEQVDLMNGISALIQRPQRAPPAFLPCEDTREMCLWTMVDTESASTWFWTFQLPKPGDIHFFYL